MNIDVEIRQVLRDVLSLGSRADALTPTSALLGVLPEVDSMAVANVIAALEERFDIVVNNDEISGEVFASVGSLSAFVFGKINGGSD